MAEIRHSGNHPVALYIGHYDLENQQLTTLLLGDAEDKLVCGLYHMHLLDEAEIFVAVRDLVNIADQDDAWYRTVDIRSGFPESYLFPQEACIHASDEEIELVRAALRGL
jgi:hypothetical protein